MPHNIASPTGAAMAPLLVLLAAVSTPATAADPDASGPAATLSALADEAVDANPGLDARQAMADQLRERATVAGAWPDPMVAVEYSNVPVDSFGLSDHPMAGLQLKLQQTLHPPAWSRQQRAVLGARADAAGAAVDEAAIALSASVEATWWGLARTRMLRSVTEDHLRRTEELLDAVRSRYEVGAAGQSATLRLTVLRDKLQDDLGDFDRTDRELTAMLDRALSRDTPSSFDTPADVAPVDAPADAAWLDLADDHRPELARLASERAAADAAVALAKTNALPDPTVWAGYRLRTVQTDTDPGRDLVSVGISVPIPSGSGRRARGDAAGWQAAGQGVDAQLAGLHDAIDADMDAILARWRRAADKTRTYDEQLIPAAESTLTATLSDFAVGRTDFASLFDAEVTLLNLERARIDAATTTWLQRAQALATLGIHPEDARP